MNDRDVLWRRGVRRPRTQNAWAVAGTFLLSLLTTLALGVQLLHWLR